MTDFCFYFGAASGSSRAALRQLKEPNVLINYATKNNEPWDGIERLFIDSGGYSFMKGKGEYTTSNAEYLDYVERVAPERFALRDYPCEEDVLAEHDRTVRDHQRKTTERHRDLLDALADYSIDARPTSVLQGWGTEQYLSHLDDLRDAGALCGDVAVGSVCRRGQTTQIRSVLRAIRDALPAKHTLHAFGVKTTILSDAAMFDVLDTADSLSYDFAQQRADADGGGASRTWQDVAFHYLKQKRRIESLQDAAGDGDTRQTRLAA